MLYRTQGLPKRLADYFAANPDEELTMEMIMVKFDARPDGAQKAILRLVEAGVLESVRVIRLPAKGRPADMKVLTALAAVGLHAYDAGE